MTSSVPLSAKDVSQRFFRKRPEDVLPLTVEHQRIYIVPSKRGLAFLLALLICLIASINYQLNLGYALSFLLAGLFAASLLHTYKNLSGLTLNSVHAKSVNCGDVAIFVLRLTNASQQDRIGLDINYANQSVRTDVTREVITNVELPLLTTQRGYLALGRLTLTSQYPIGLWTTWSYCHSPTSVIVYPKPELNPPPLPRSIADGDADALQHSVQGDVASLRDYVPGDPLTHIAWKRVARGSGLHVREQEENRPSGDIELSSSATEIQDIEAQMSRLAAWVNQAHSLSAAYSLTLDGQHIKTDSGDAHRQTCLELLATYKTATAPGASV